MNHTNGWTWGWVDTLTVTIKMAAWGVCLGGLVVAVLLTIATWRDIVREQDEDEHWLPAERRRWRP